MIILVLRLLNPSVGDEAKKVYFFEKKIQNGRLKILSFSKSPIPNIEQPHDNIS
jgi:hypothetical protein